MLSAWKPRFCFLLALALWLPLAAQESPSIEVSDVSFDRVASNWTSATIRIRPDRNPLPDAIDEDYVDDVRLSFYTCYEVDRGPDGDQFSFYNSEVRMVSLDRAKTYQVVFFLPGVIRDRDDLDLDPFAWVVEMEVGGVKVPLDEDQYGGEIQTRNAYDSFLSRASSEGSANDGIMLPIYLTPFYIVNESRVNLGEVPAFYRFEATN